MLRRMDKNSKLLLWKVGRRIGELRKKKKLTQDGLAHKMGITTRLVARWEGKENMKVLTLYRISKILKCKPVDFFKEPSPKHRKPSFSKSRRRRSR